MPGATSLPITLILSARNSLSPVLSRVNRQFSSLPKSMNLGLLAAAELTTGIGMAASKIGNYFLDITQSTMNVGIDLDNSMARIAAVVGDAKTNIQKLQESFLSMADTVNNVSKIVLPESADSLAKTGLEIAKVGFESRESILKMTEAATMFSVVSGDISAEKSARELSSAMLVLNDAGIFATKANGELEDAIGFGKKLDQLMSSITKSANLVQASPGNMLDFIRRMGGPGKNIGLATSEILGLAAAASKVGYTSEQAAVPLSRLFTEMMQHKDVLANMYGKPADVIIKAMKSNAGLTREIVFSLFEQMGMGATEFVDILANLGVGTRASLISLFSTLSQNVDMMENLGITIEKAYSSGDEHLKNYDKIMGSILMKWKSSLALLNDIKIRMFLPLEAPVRLMLDSLNMLLSNINQLPKGFFAIAGIAVVTAGAFFVVGGAVLTLVGTLVMLGEVMKFLNVIMFKNWASDITKSKTAIVDLNNILSSKGKLGKGMVGLLSATVAKKSLQHAQKKAMKPQKMITTIEGFLIPKPPKSPNPQKIANALSGGITKKVAKMSLISATKKFTNQVKTMSFGEKLSNIFFLGFTKPLQSIKFGSIFMKWFGTPIIAITTLSSALDIIGVKFKDFGHIVAALTGLLSTLAIVALATKLPGIKQLATGIGTIGAGIKTRSANMVQNAGVGGLGFGGKMGSGMLSGLGIALIGFSDILIKPFMMFGKFLKFFLSGFVLNTLLFIDLAKSFVGPLEVFKKLLGPEGLLGGLIFFGGILTSVFSLMTGFGSALVGLPLIIIGAFSLLYIGLKRFWNDSSSFSTFMSEMSKTFLGGIVIGLINGLIWVVNFAIGSFQIFWNDIVKTGLMNFLNYLIDILNFFWPGKDFAHFQVPESLYDKVMNGPDPLADATEAQKNIISKEKELLDKFKLILPDVEAISGIKKEYFDINKMLKEGVVEQILKMTKEDVGPDKLIWLAKMDWKKWVITADEAVNRMGNKLDTMTEAGGDPKHVKTINEKADQITREALSGKEEEIKQQLMIKKHIDSINDVLGIMKFSIKDAIALAETESTWPLPEFWAILPDAVTGKKDQFAKEMRESITTKINETLDIAPWIAYGSIKKAKDSLVNFTENLTSGINSSFKAIDEYSKSSMASEFKDKLKILFSDLIPLDSYKNPDLIPEDFKRSADNIIGNVIDFNKSFDDKTIEMQNVLFSVFTNTSDSFTSLYNELEKQKKIKEITDLPFLKLGLITNIQNLDEDSILTLHKNLENAFGSLSKLNDMISEISSSRGEDFKWIDKLNINDLLTGKDSFSMPIGDYFHSKMNETKLKDVKKQVFNFGTTKWLDKYFTAENIANTISGNIKDITANKKKVNEAFYDSLLPEDPFFTQEPEQKANLRSKKMVPMYFMEPLNKEDTSKSIWGEGGIWSAIQQGADFFKMNNNKNIYEIMKEQGKNAKFKLDIEETKKQIEEMRHPMYFMEPLKKQETGTDIGNIWEILKDPSYFDFSKKKEQKDKDETSDLIDIIRGRGVFSVNGVFKIEDNKKYPMNFMSPLSNPMDIVETASAEIFSSKYLGTTMAEKVASVHQEAMNEVESEKEMTAQINIGPFELPINLDGSEIARKMINIKEQIVKIRFGKPTTKNFGASSLSLSENI